MVQAKPEMKARARELRRAGKTYDEITAELGVAKSSVSLWVRDLPKPSTPPERIRHMSEARWGPHRRAVAIKRQKTKLAAAQEIGRLSDRELFLVGVGLYWSEGAKAKPHAPKERVIFVNSDPDMIALFTAWLRLIGVERERLRFGVQIHESADVSRAEHFWADFLDIEVSGLQKTVLKRHRPQTNRKNTGEDYHGCLRVTVNEGADLYRRIEGWWYGIVVAAR